MDDLDAARAMLEQEIADWTEVADEHRRNWKSATAAKRAAQRDLSYLRLADQVVAP